MQWLLPFNNTMHFLVAGFGTIVFSLYIIYDTWMISQRMGPDDYITAVINLYLDIRVGMHYFSCSEFFRSCDLSTAACDCTFMSHTLASTCSCTSCLSSPAVNEKMWRSGLSAVLRPLQ